MVGFSGSINRSFTLSPSRNCVLIPVSPLTPPPSQSRFAMAPHARAQGTRLTTFQATLRDPKDSATLGGTSQAAIKKSHDHVQSLHHTQPHDPPSHSTILSLDVMEIAPSLPHRRMAPCRTLDPRTECTSHGHGCLAMMRTAEWLRCVFLCAPHVRWPRRDSSRPCPRCL